MDNSELLDIANILQLAIVVRCYLNDDKLMGNITHAKDDEIGKIALVLKYLKSSN